MFITMARLQSLMRHLSKEKEGVSQKGYFLFNEELIFMRRNPKMEGHAKIVHVIVLKGETLDAGGLRSPNLFCPPPDPLLMLPSCPPIPMLPTSQTFPLFVLAAFSLAMLARVVYVTVTSMAARNTVTTVYYLHALPWWC